MYKTFFFKYSFSTITCVFFIIVVFFANKGHIFYRAIYLFKKFLYIMTPNTIWFFFLFFVFLIIELPGQIQLIINWYVSYFCQKVEFDIRLPPSSETICIKWQILFSFGKKKKIQNLICWNFYPACRALSIILLFMTVCSHFTWIIYFPGKDGHCVEWNVRHYCFGKLTHLYLRSHIRDFGKQCRPRSDAMDWNFYKTWYIL